jgi:PhnB protein
MPIELLVNIDVENLDRAIEFYARAFDLQLGRQLSEDVVEMVGASAPIYLLAKSAGSFAAVGTSQRRDYSRHWTPVHLDLVVPDIGAAVQKAVASGARLESEIQTDNWGRIANMADPFGNGFCLIEFIGRGYDEIVITRTKGDATMAVKPIPEGYHTATPYLIVNNAAQAIDFYKRAFGATERMRMVAPSGEVAHAEIQIGDSPIMLADEMPGMPWRSPLALGGSPVSIMLYVEDVDALFRQAVEAGGKVEKPVQDQFYGDRSGTLTDPFGHVWNLSTHKEDVSPEEIRRRAEALFKQQGT